MTVTRATTGHGTHHDRVLSFLFRGGLSGLTTLLPPACLGLGMTVRPGTQTRRVSRRPRISPKPNVPATALDAAGKVSNQG